MTLSRGNAKVRSLFDNKRPSQRSDIVTEQDEIWTIKEVVAYLKCCRKTADRLLAANNVKRFGSKGSSLIRYRKADIVAMLKPV